MDDRAVWRRLQRLSHVEGLLIKKEAGIAKKYAKFREKSVEVKRVVAEIEDQDAAQTNRLATLNAAVTKLKEYCNELEQRLQKSKANVTCLEQEWQAQPSSKLKNMAKFSCLKDLTHLFINCHALPRSIQGVALSEKTDTTQWKPFRIEPELASGNELQIIFAEAQLNSVYNVKWEALTSRTPHPNTSNSDGPPSDDVK